MHRGCAISPWLHNASGKWRPGAVPSAASKQACKAPNPSTRSRPTVTSCNTRYSTYLAGALQVLRQLQLTASMQSPSLLPRPHPGTDQQSTDATLLQQEAGTTSAYLAVAGGL
jgi:hypothetical protein